METHRIHPELLERQVRVLVVGCGGTGSAVVAGLPYLHQSLVARGHPGGLHVTVMDGDTISATNCIRQPFARSEIGLNKAIVLVNRLNMFWGLKWEAVPVHLKQAPSSRAAIQAMICVLTLWLGAWIRGLQGQQFVMPSATGARFPTHSIWATIQIAGSSSWVSRSTSEIGGQGYDSDLRAELFPEIVDPSLDDDGQPSCSAAAALERQEPFINSTLAQHALALLARLFRYGEAQLSRRFHQPLNGHRQPSAD